jgi:hypothetical protein
LVGGNGIVEEKTEEWKEEKGMPSMERDVTIRGDGRSGERATSLINERF